MAALNTQAREEVWAEFMRWLSDQRLPCGITKADVLAAVAAMDDLMTSSETTINNAFPTAARNNLTPQQKSRVLAYVVLKRYEAT